MPPFIEDERREPAIKGTLKEPQRGDFCFLEYRPMIMAWKKSQRWTTADMLYQQYLRRRESISESKPKTAALDLAWQVFFALHVLPYEVRKRKENGEVQE